MIRINLGTANIHICSVLSKLSNKQIASGCVHREQSSIEAEDGPLKKILFLRDTVLLLVGNSNLLGLDRLGDLPRCCGGRHVHKKDRALTQHVRPNTRFRPGKQSSIPDVVISKYGNGVHSLECRILLGKVIEQRSLLPSDLCMTMFLKYYTGISGGWK